MVAITVILAAVIGAFVLEIGDQQETAPNASFSSDEQVTYVNEQTACCKARQGNITTVQVTHAGGDSLPVDQTQLSLNGNDSVWGPTDYSRLAESGITTNPVATQPNVCETVGGKSAEVSSGQTLSVAGSGGDPADSVMSVTDDYTIDKWLVSDEQLVQGGVTTGDGASAGWSGKSWYPSTIDCGAGPYYMGIRNNGPKVTIANDPGGGNYQPQQQFVHLPMGDDKVQVVWEASSGGKTQTLYRYTVQTDSPMLN